MSKRGRTTPKDQKSSSSQIQPLSSPATVAAPTVERDKLEEWRRYIYPDVNTEITDDEMVQKLFPTHQLKDEAPLPPKTWNTPKGSRNPNYCEYLNTISRILRETSKVEYTIQFYPSKSTGRATRTYSHPNIVAIRHGPGQNIDTNHLSWSHLETTGGEHSDQPDPHVKASAYTSFHLHVGIQYDVDGSVVEPLARYEEVPGSTPGRVMFSILQARPDLVSVVGILVSPTSFIIFFSNACRVLHTTVTSWKTKKARRLLWAYIWHLYNPDVDPSVRIDLTVNPPHFSIKGVKDGGTHDGFVVWHTGDSVGRRSIILENMHNSLVIKEQYIEDVRIFEEGPMLEKIHKDGRFPGIVRLDSYEPEIKDPKTGSRIQCQYDLPGSEDTLTRFKTRLVMKDKGTRLMDEETPRSFLMGVYDLLEITRMLYKKCNILHRDISPGNVLVHTEPISYTEEFRKDLDDMYFSAYLLDKLAGQGPNSHHQLETRTILIDFDCGEDQVPDHPLEGVSGARVGTPNFMARMVRSKRYPEGLSELPPIPSVDPERVPHYPKDRLEAFPSNNPELIRIPRSVTRPDNEFRHLLRYDAESVYWCILWWCIRALPVNHVKGSPGERMAAIYWLYLISERDSRHIFLRGFPDKCLHPSYSKLEVLLDDMASLLQGDLSFAREGNRLHPEYLHEAFQRTILNFLVTNASEEFMDLKKGQEPRIAEETAMKRTGSTRWSETFRTQSTEPTPSPPTANNTSQSTGAGVSQRTRPKTSGSKAQKRVHDENSRNSLTKHKRRRR